MNEIKLGKYRHFKGGLYELVGFCRHSETLEEMVIYRALYEGGETWVRPAAMWCETLTYNGIAVPRFSYIPEE